MRKLAEFFGRWGAFIALCLIVAALLALFTLGEFKCGSALLRILIGIFTLPFAGLGVVAAILDYYGIPQENDGE